MPVNPSNQEPAVGIEPTTAPYKEGQTHSSPASTGTQAADSSAPLSPNRARNEKGLGNETATVRRGRTLEYHREWRRTPEGRASLRASQDAYLARHPERVTAHRIVAEARRRGEVKAGPCELAGSECKGRIEAHHDDYAKPLEIRWLCKSHHKKADQARRRVEVA